MGASELIIRAATPEEYAAVGELTVDVYVGEGYVRPGSPYVAELADAERRAAAAAEVLVAVYDDRVIGSLTVASYGTPYAEIARPGELEFRMLAVAKRARGLGAGTALVRTVIEMASERGCEAVALTTMSAMADARRIYDRFGFVAVPERDWTTQAGELLTVLRLPLPAR
ncbi:GNAT family N-acetyltransferase [Nocardia bhagyanarayanae]|uniref:Putative N-acetyltransferase YhbS n=1 Tax=Nocardia bhagyanarayanae TaxID=1215925 RepID=A0A543FBS3_9NOCA|nr:GNAT family N-acetyltransferase [Nocardia bhagyanarayanae]TQM31260.1 putative N-acetyltransferase YhbS [Nocardia bhagyanarayanae]